LLYGLLIFGFNMIAFSIALSAFFTDSKLAVQTGVTIIVLPSSLVSFLFAKIQMDKMTASMNAVLTGEGAEEITGRWIQWLYFFP
jgi:hypothetical protein